MGSGIDDAKGKAKEAAGDLTGDKRLEREGKLDQAGATVKEKFENAEDKVEEVVDKAKDKLSDKK